MSALLPRDTIIAPTLEKEVYIYTTGGILETEVLYGRPVEAEA
jgi:hypothetical protein